MVLASASAIAGDDIEMIFSGEVKTGLLWDMIEEPGQTTIDRARLGNNDDAGIPGRIRLDGELVLKNIGFKMRWETQNFSNVAPGWAYAMAYGDFIDNQLRLSGGRLGQSPWSSGGPEIWDELDNRAGLRVEIKPNAMPGINVGFVLNENNIDATNTEFSILPMLAETIIGFSYTHDYFHIRAAYRLDSDQDSSIYADGGLSEGTDFIYRVEERALRNVVEGLSIYANGRLLGIGAEATSRINYINWLYIQYNPGALDVQLRTGLDYGYQKYMFKLKPVISYGITDFFTVGFTFIYNKDYGEAATAPNAPYTIMAFEPMVRVNFNNMYVALAYQFNREYKTATTIKQTNWVNLRFVYTF